MMKIDHLTCKPGMTVRWGWVDEKGKARIGTIIQPSRKPRITAEKLAFSFLIFICGVMAGYTWAVLAYGKVLGH